MMRPCTLFLVTVVCAALVAHCSATSGLEALVGAATALAGKPSAKFLEELKHLLKGVTLKPSSPFLYPAIEDHSGASRSIADMLKLFANFVGDSFIGGRPLINPGASVPESVTNTLQGGRPGGDSLQFLSELVAAVSTSFGASQAELLKLLSIRLGVGAVLGNLAQQSRKVTARAVKLIIKHELERLGALLLPCGWGKDSNMGHSITVEITLDQKTPGSTLRVRLYNVGDGLQLHGSTETKDRLNYVPFVEFHGVPREVLLDTDVILRLLQMGKSSAELSAVSVYQSIMSPLLKYTSDAIDSAALSMTARKQQGGTCTMTSPMMAILGSIGDREVYATLKTEMELVALDNALKALEASQKQPQGGAKSYHAFLDLEAAWRFMLVEVRSNLARRHLKTEANLFHFEQRLKDAIAFLDASNALKPIPIHIEGYAVGPRSDDLASNYAVPRLPIDSDAEALSFVAQKDDDEVVWMQSDGAPLTRLERIAKSYAQCKTVMELDMMVADVLALPMPPAATVKAWASIKTPAAADAALGHIDTIVNALSACNPFVPSFPRTTPFPNIVALAQLLATSWNLAVFSDDLQQLRHYSLDALYIIQRLARPFNDMLSYEDSLNVRADELVAFFTSKVNSSNAIYQDSWFTTTLDGKTVRHLLHNGLFVQHVGWEINSPGAMTESISAQHTKFIEGTPQVGFNKLLLERAEMITKSGSSPLTSVQQNEIVGAKDVNCSPEKNLIMFLASWEKLPRGSLHFMGTVHRAYVAFHQYTNGATTFRMRAAPVRCWATVSSPSTMDSCYTRITYMEHDEHPYTCGEADTEWHTKRLTSHEWVLDSALNVRVHSPIRDDVFGGANDAIAAFDDSLEVGSYQNARDNKIVMASVLPQKKNKLLVSQSWVAVFMRILLTPIASSMPRLLVEWSAGRIDINEPVQQRLVNRALFRRQGATTLWTLQTPVVPALFQLIRESIDSLIIEEHREGDNKRSTPLISKRRKTLIFLFATAFRIIRLSIDAKVSLANRVGLFDATIIWRSMRVLMVNVVLQLGARLSVDERSLAFTAHIISYRPSEDTFTDLLRWQARRFGVKNARLHSHSFMDIEANQIIARHMRAVVASIVAMSPTDRNAFIATLARDRFGATMIPLDGFEWKCGVARTWCVGSRGDDRCKLDLIQPDLQCRIAGNYDSRQLDHSSIGDLDWFNSAFKGGLHEYAPATGAILVSNIPSPIFRLLPAATSKAPIWRHIDIIVEEHWCPTAIPSRVKLFPSGELRTRIHPAEFMVQMSAEWLAEAHPGFVVPSLDKELHIWVTVELRDKPQLVIITNWAGKLLASATIDVGVPVIRSYSKIGGGDRLLDQDWTLLEMKLDVCGTPVRQFHSAVSMFESKSVSNSRRLVFNELFIEQRVVTFSLTSADPNYVLERSSPQMFIARNQYLAGRHIHPSVGKGMLLLMSSNDQRRALVVAEGLRHLAVIDVKREVCLATGFKRDRFIPSTRLDRLIVVQRLLRTTEYHRAFDLLIALDTMTTLSAAEEIALSIIITENTKDNNPLALSVRALALLTCARLQRMYGDIDGIKGALDTAPYLLARYYQIHRNIPIAYRILLSTHPHHTALFFSRDEEIDLLDSIGADRFADLRARRDWLALADDGNRLPRQRKTVVRFAALQLSHPTKLTVSLLDTLPDFNEALSKDRQGGDFVKLLDNLLLDTNPFEPMFIAFNEFLTVAVLLPIDADKDLVGRLWSFLQLRSVSLRDGHKAGDDEIKHAILCQVVQERFPLVANSSLNYDRDGNGVGLHAELMNLSNGVTRSHIAGVTLKDEPLLAVEYIGSVSSPSPPAINLRSQPFPRLSVMSSE